MSEDNTPVQDEISALKARADMLGIAYHPSIGVEKLREKVSAALSDKPPPVAEVEVAAPAVETEGIRLRRLKQEANALIRIRVVNMNPAKKEWEGEIFTVGNSLVGTIKKFVPFNLDEGWHVPRMIYEQLVERQCQVFVAIKHPNGVTTQKSKLIKEFAIEVLPPLTPTQLHELAQRQAMAKTID
jgi:hypothetical protein